MQVLAVTLGNHAHKSWRAALTYEFAAVWAMQPVVQAEAEKVAANFPMAFHQRDGTWDLVALLGVQPGHSLAVSRQGQWLGRYIPALIRAHPFTLATPQGACMASRVSLGMRELSAKGPRLPPATTQTSACATSMSPSASATSPL